MHLSLRFNLLFLLVFNLCLSSFGSLKEDETNPDFGIHFERPDTITTLEAFNRNDTTRFLTDRQTYLERYYYAKHSPYYQKQRIADGENTFLNFRYKGDHYWFRHTFWIYLKNNKIPALRHRVFIEHDLKDTLDQNDLLVYQVNYLAAQVTDPYHKKQEFNPETTFILDWMEAQIPYMYYDGFLDWFYIDYSQRHQIANQEYGNSGNWPTDEYVNTRSINPWYLNLRQLYLGRSPEHPLDLFMLMFVVGDVKGYYPNGQEMISYKGFLNRKKEFQLKVIKREKWLHRYTARRYVSRFTTHSIDYALDKLYSTGIDGKFVMYYRNGAIHYSCEYVNGLKHGTQVINYDDSDRDTIDIGYTNVTRGYEENEYRYDLITSNSSFSRNGALDSKGYFYHSKREWRQAKRNMLNKITDGR